MHAGIGQLEKIVPQAGRNDEPSFVDLGPISGLAGRHVLAADFEVSINARPVDVPVLGSVADQSMPSLHAVVLTAPAAALVSAHSIC